MFHTMTESNDVESSITALKPKTRFKRWINQYINMIGNEPGLIYPCYNDNLTQAEISTIQEKASAYSSLYVELGSGSGRHLLQMASFNPKALFIGFELRFKRVFVTAKKAKTQNIQNIKASSYLCFSTPNYFRYSLF